VAAIIDGLKDSQSRQAYLSYQAAATFGELFKSDTRF
jgi:hypothetical protein